MPPKEVELARAVIEELKEQDGFNDWWFLLRNEYKEAIMQDLYTVIRIRLAK